MGEKGDEEEKKNKKGRNKGKGTSTLCKWYNIKPRNQNPTNPALLVCPYAPVIQFIAKV